MITIITVVYNDKQGFLRTLKCVDAQKKYINPPVEYIVVDGLSTDGTVDVIKSNLSKIDKWVSEPDLGIYDAMNKGIDMSSGDFYLFLNAGDIFVGDVLSKFKLSSCFLPVKYKNIFGNLKTIKIKHVMRGMPNCHQGIIFKNKSIRYDTGYKICADYKFFLSHGYDSHLSMLKSDGYILYDSTGISSTAIKQRDKEYFKLRRDFFGLFYAVVFEMEPLLKRFARWFLSK